MHILELVEQAERDDWMGSHGWVKPTSFHCVIELVGVCVSEGEREVLQVRLCMCVEREREGERELKVYCVHVSMCVVVRSTGHQSHLCNQTYFSHFYPWQLIHSESH